MQIQPVNITPDKSQTQNFTGKAIIRGFCWDKDVYEAINKVTTPSYKKLFEGHDVIIRKKTHISSGRDGYHCPGEHTYKIIISRVKENSLLSRIADTLHLKPRHSLTKLFHSHDGIIGSMDERHFSKLLNKFESKNK